jgi:endo-alpha-1,4-polygalactosaminidase (GH114 family)
MNHLFIFYYTGKFYRKICYTLGMIRLIKILVLLLSLLIVGCKPASASPSPAPVSTQVPTPTPVPVPPVEDWWRPAPGLSWQWQLSDFEIDTSIQADVYDIDLDVDASVIGDLHAKGRWVICYISVGSQEDWRADKDQFPAEVLDNDYDGWPGEKWLDIRQIDKLAPVMRARLDRCASKGFDAVEPDNMEVYTNDTGFPLTYEDQLKYARWLADEAHQRGLAIGQKNASDQVLDLVQVYDFAITEDYFFYNEAESMLPYIKAGKPVFAAEYTDLAGDFESFCARSMEFGFSTILKNRELDSWVQTCK